jgi:UDP-N-acetylglucosamine 1-carboxyvinyltransferase
VLRNVPRLRDVDAMLELLRALGAGGDRDAADDHCVRIDARRVTNLVAPYDIVRKMRASFMVLGPLLARFGSARVSEPGGCAIGVRPSTSTEGPRGPGAKIRLDHVRRGVSAAGGRSHRLRREHVSGTQGVMMAARSPGRAVIEALRAARVTGSRTCSGWGPRSAEPEATASWSAAWPRCAASSTRWRATASRPAPWRRPP